MYDDKRSFLWVLVALLLSTQTHANEKRVNVYKIEPHQRHQMMKADIRCQDDNCRERKHRFKEGFVLPQHYRGNAYKVDYRQDNLTRPNNNQQWYKINGDYILLDTEKNRIIQIHDD